MRAPYVLQALSPVPGVTFLFHHGSIGFVVLGSVFLAVTGAEALYADMGHFGRRPIQTAWLSLVLPALLLNYLGQGALLLRDPQAVENPFYLLAPSWSVLPLVILSTAATVIASQAVITGAFSLVSQAIQLGLLPRLEIVHTSSRQEGQILHSARKPAAAAWRARAGAAVPFVGRARQCLRHCGFRHHGDDDRAGVFRRLAAVEMADLGRAPAGVHVPVIDVSFFIANLYKVLDGGWVPLMLGFGDVHGDVDVAARQCAAFAEDAQEIRS